MRDKIKEKRPSLRDFYVKLTSYKNFVVYLQMHLERKYQAKSKSK